MSIITIQAEGSFFFWWKIFQSFRKLERPFSVLIFSPSTKSVLFSKKDKVSFFFHQVQILVFFGVLPLKVLWSEFRLRKALFFCWCLEHKLFSCIVKGYFKVVVNFSLLFFFLFCWKCQPVWKQRKFERGLDVREYES